MPSFGTADACGHRLLANRTGFHEVLYPYQGQLLQWTAPGKEPTAAISWRPAKEEEIIRGVPYVSSVEEETGMCP
jgi:hypothetical protein